MTASTFCSSTAVRTGLHNASPSRNIASKADIYLGISLLVRKLLMLRDIYIGVALWRWQFRRNVILSVVLAKAVGVKLLQVFSIEIKVFQCDAV